MRQRVEEDAWHWVTMKDRAWTKERPTKKTPLTETRQTSPNRWAARSRECESEHQALHHHMVRCI